MIFILLAILILLLYKNVTLKITYHKKPKVEIEYFPFVLKLTDFSRSKKKRKKRFKPAKTFRKIIPSIKATRYFISRSKPLPSNDDREITLFYSAIRVYNLIFTLLIYGFHRIIRRVG